MPPDIYISDLVVERHGEPVTTSLAIAEGTRVEHASVIKLVRTYLEDLEEFGRVGFEIAPFETAGGVQHRDVAFLNEPQSTLLLTYMRNSDIVRSFKKALVRAFFELRDAFAGQADAPSMPTSVAHRADHIVAATRSFNNMLRTAQGLRMSHARAARMANEATLRHTGFDLLAELGVTDEDLAEVAPPAPARQITTKVDPIVRVLDFIKSRGAAGASNREVIAYCRAFREISDAARADLVARMLLDGDIVITYTQSGKGRVMVHASFAESAT